MVEREAGSVLEGAILVDDADLGGECTGGTEAGCEHRPIVVGGRKPQEMPLFQWMNIILANVKTSLSGTYHAFAFGKYAARYLGAIAYRFNRRFTLHALQTTLGRCDNLWPMPGALDSVG